MNTVKTRSIKKIRGAIHEEKEAIKDYRKDAKRVDPATAKRFREIARDEVHHKRELSKLLTRHLKRK